MCNPNIHPDTYTAVKLWLQILKEYDDRYLKENIADFKSRYIQQQALLSQIGAKANPEKILAYMEIDDNSYLISSESSDEHDSEIRKFDKSVADIHALELQIYIEPEQIKTNLEEELENLSETLNDFVDIDDNLIDFFK